MNTSDNNFTVGSVYVRQVTENAFERDAAGAYAKEVTLPGFLEACIDVNGVPWVIARRKAPGLLADIQRANDQQAVSQASPVEPAARTDVQEQPPEQQPEQQPGGIAGFFRSPPSGEPPTPQG